MTSVAEKGRIALKEYIDEIECGYPVTEKPQNFYAIRGVGKHFHWWGTIGNPHEIVCYTNTETGIRHAHDKSLNFIKGYVTRMHGKELSLVTCDAVSVSFAVKGFAFEKYNKLKPITKKPWNGTFTYQHITRHCEAIYYNEQGVQFLAGFKYLLQPRNTTFLSHKQDEYAMDNAIREANQYPLIDRKKTAMYKKNKGYSRYCTEAGKRVHVRPIHWDFGNPDKLAYHIRFDHSIGKWHYTWCTECTEEAKTYKFNPKTSEGRVTVERPWYSCFVSKKTSDDKNDKKDKKDEKPEEKKKPGSIQKLIT